MDEKRYMDDMIEVEQLAGDFNLYHYSTVSGIKGIIESNQFWASRFDFLNDMSEFKYIYSLLQEVIEENIIGTENQEKLLKCIKEDSVWGIYDNHRGKNEEYVISLSTERDSLALWAEFSGSVGYNIGFRGQELIELLHKKYTIMWNGKIIYDIEEQKSKIKKLIFDKIPQILNKSFDDIISEVEPTKDGLLDFAQVLVMACSVYAMFFKKEEFKDENEYRIVISNIGKKKTPVLFREKDGFLLPYVEVKIDEDGERLPISQITVGPKNSIDLAINGMEVYLIAKGYNPDIVKKTSLSLRY